jgi:hypothetical protein
MSCRYVPLLTGRSAIVCAPRPRLQRCIVCNQPETMTSLRLCDAPLSETKTCNAVICVDHAVHVAPNHDYCPHHARGLEEPA